MNNWSLSSLIAKLLLAFSVIAFLASIRAIENPNFRKRLLRDPHYLKQETRITLASAWLSALWWAVMSVFLTLMVLHIRSNGVADLLEPMAGFLLVAWALTTYREYRRRKRSH